MTGELADLLGDCLEPLGFTVDESSRVKGTYRGTVEGRSVRVSPVIRSRTRYSTPDISRRVYDGFSLEIAVDTTIQTRLAVSHPPRGSDDNVVVRLAMAAVTRWNGLRKMASPHADFKGLNVWAFDPSWARRCLSDETVRGTLRNLRVHGEAWTDARYSTWSFGPGTMGLVMSPALETITPEAMETWIISVVRLAQLAENEPTERIAKKSRLEKKAEENPNAVILYVLAVLFGVPLLLMLLLAIFFIVGWRLVGERVMIVPIIFMFFFMPYAMFLVLRQWFRQARDKLRPPE